MSTGAYIEILKGGDTDGGGQIFRKISSILWKLHKRGGEGMSPPPLCTPINVYICLSCKIIEHQRRQKLSVDQATHTRSGILYIQYFSIIPRLENYKSSGESHQIFGQWASKYRSWTTQRKVHPRAEKFSYYIILWMYYYWTLMRFVDFLSFKLISLIRWNLSIDWWKVLGPLRQPRHHLIIRWISTGYPLDPPGYPPYRFIIFRPGCQPFPFSTFVLWKERGKLISFACGSSSTNDLFPPCSWLPPCLLSSKCKACV